MFKKYCCYATLVPCLLFFNVAHTSNHKSLDQLLNEPITKLDMAILQMRLRNEKYVDDLQNNYYFPAKTYIGRRASIDYFKDYGFHFKVKATFDTSTFRDLGPKKACSKVMTIAKSVWGVNDTTSAIPEGVSKSLLFTFFLPLGTYNEISYKDAERLGIALEKKFTITVRVFAGFNSYQLNCDSELLSNNIKYYFREYY